MGFFLDRRTWKRDLFGKPGPEPSYPRLPLVDDAGRSNITGLYVVGEVGGVPLIKLGLNQGAEVADRLHAELGASNTDKDLYDVVIVGTGSAGLAAALRCHELGMRYVALDANRMAMTVVNMYKGKWLFAEPVNTPLKSNLWFEECDRETLLERWRRQVEETGLHVHEHEKVTDIQRVDGGFTVTSEKTSYRTRRVVLAVGKAGNPRKAGVPGELEHAAKVHHSLADPAEHTGRNVLVYGGGDVAAEAALALCGTNRVALVTIDREFVFPKKRNVDALRREEKAGRLKIFMASRLKRIEAGAVTFTDGSGQEQTITNDVVFEMIGAELPLAFFKKVGIKLEGTWDVKRWLTLAAVAVGVYSLYALKKFPETPYSWPFYHLIPREGFAETVRSMFQVAFSPFAWIFTREAYDSILATTWFQTGYLYSLTYTIVMLVFGVQAFRRWSGIARDNRYQKWRYTSLIAFQIGFFLIANVVAVQALSVQHAWRAWGLYQPWPLFFNTFNWWNSSDPRAVLYGFVGAGLVGTFVGIPWLSHKHGKRFCTWICGCGGLAETLGDRWRHQSPKGSRSRAWEFQATVVLVAAAVVTLITVGAFHTRADNAWAKAYAYIVDFWLVAVIPVALYPFFGGKVWCRYWCPLAAWNQVLAAWYGRLKITSNDKCITCGLCSRHCQVGVDVMAFAKNQEPFDNRNSSCIHCGICIDVCPMDVLEFDDSAPPLPSRSKPELKTGGSTRVP